MENITLQNESLSAIISPLGAEIQSVQNAAGAEFIWQGDASHWRRHAPILFPVAGSFKDGIYKMNGQTYSLPQHGFVRDRVFTAESVSSRTCTFLLSGEAAAHAGYPFPFALRARYTLWGNRLTAETLVYNTGDAPLYYSAGAHEAYACPGGPARYALRFDEPEAPLRRAVFKGSALCDAYAPVAMEGDTLPVTEALFAQDTLVLPLLASRGVALEGPDRRIHVAYEDFPYLLVWTQWGAEYLCIEPWHNLPDYADTDHDFTQKPGVIRVEPGAESRLAHTITFTKE